MGLNYHTVILMEDGTVRSVGWNLAGQLGIGSTSNTATVSTPVIGGVKQVVCGSQHTLFLMSDGTVKAVGKNDQGQLGLGNVTTPITSISNVPGLTNVKQIASTDTHTVFLMNDGTVKSVGFNQFGQLGTGSVTASPYYVTAIQTPAISGVKQISCGGNYTMFLMNDGTVKAVGYNGYGQLGLGNTTSPIATISNVPDLTGVNQIACGTYHTMFLMNDGTVKSVGYNGSGELGLGNTTSPITSISNVSISGVKQIACGSNYTMFLMNDGTVKGVGANSDGQLGTGNVTNPTTTISAVPGLTGVRQISCGGSYTMFLMNDKTVRSVGGNAYGQLAIGTTTPSPNYLTAIQTPTLAGVKTLWGDALGAIKKFLLRIGSDIKKISSLSLDIVGAAPATEDMFKTYGTDNLTNLNMTTSDTLSFTNQGTLGAGKVFSVQIPACYDIITKLVEKV